MKAQNNFAKMTFAETRSILIKLIPFILSILIYFCGFIPHHDKVLLAFTKCLPVLCLIIFIGLYSMDIKAECYTSSFTWNVKMISLALFFSGVGDALLIWPATFQFCVVAYSFAQIHYILAFGCEPHAWILGLFGCILASAISIFLSSGLSGPDLFLIPTYTFIVLTTIWRACAPFGDRKYWSCVRWTTVFGSILFGLSHFIIGVERYKMRLIYINEFDMVLYYVAQLLMTLSIMEPYIDSSSSGMKFT